MEHCIPKGFIEVVSDETAEQILVPISAIVGVWKAADGKAKLAWAGNTRYTTYHLVTKDRYEDVLKYIDGQATI